MTNARYEFWTRDEHVTSEWFLFEALLWISDQRIPHAGESADWFVSEWQYSHFEPIPPDLSRSSLMHLEQVITDEAGIGPCPMSFHHYSSHVDEIEKRIIELEGFLKVSKGAVKETYERQIRELEDLLHDRTEWMVDLEAYLDEAKTKLFMLLRKGELTAYGTKLPTRSMDSAKRHVKDHRLDYQTVKAEPIPPKAWNLSNVLWTDCALQTLANTYVCVFLKRDDLITSFRPIFKGLVKGGHVDGYMITNENPEIEETTESFKEPSISKTGRPSYNWDAFYIEVTRQIVSETLPVKQMAAVSDFQAWFLKTQNQSVGQSTIAEKLRPYYREFVRPKSRK